MRSPVRMLLLCLAAATAAPAWSEAPVPPELAAEAAQAGRLRVLVRLAAPHAAHGTPGERSAGRAAIERAADGALASVGALPARLRRYRALPLLALEVSPGELEALAQASEVIAIGADRLLQPSLTESIPRIGADVSVAAGWDGSGTSVVVVDTGVDASHPFFEGRVTAEACFSSGNDCPNGEDVQLGPGSAVPCTYGSLCWHGTHVAGIAAGRNPTLHGVAPGATLAAIQVGSQLYGSGCGTAGSPCVVIHDSDALAALDHVVDTLAPGGNVASVNMSFGSTTTWPDEAMCDTANPGYKVAFDALAALGIAPVVASGNGSVTTGTSAPACVSSAIAVGATIDTGEQVWVKTNSGPPLDFFAPGTNITSSIPLTLGTYSSQTGTSMAAPHVAGAFAALRQADPAASLATLRLALADTGLPVTDPRNGLIRPRTQVDDAVRARAPAACFDGLDNDGDNLIDVDGDGGSPDPDCTDGFDGSESAPPPGSCGIGPELALVLGLLARVRRRPRVRARA